MIAHFIFFVCYIAIVLIFTYLDFTNEELKRKNDILKPVPTEIGKHKIRDKAEIFIRGCGENDNRRENI